MAEEQLNLLKPATRRAAHLRACAPKVMRRDPGNTSRCRVPLEQLPDDLLAQADGLRLTTAVYRSEHVTVSDAGASRPRIGRYLDPGRHRNRPHPAMLPHEINDAPPTVALLDV